MRLGDKKAFLFNWEIWNSRRSQLSIYEGHSVQRRKKSWSQDPKVGIDLAYLRNQNKPRMAGAQRLEGRGGILVGDRQAQANEGLENGEVFSFCLCVTEASGGFLNR